MADLAGHSKMDLTAGSYSDVYNIRYRLYCSCVRALCLLNNSQNPGHNISYHTQATMSGRYSREEKKKWITAQNQAKRKPLVQIPDTDTTALIEEKKFTLIGRVTNPTAQNTKALVDFFLQHWNVAGRFTGRALGPLMFQFRFENERDLLTILNKAPFHFKRWMLLIQRWEPVVSDKFPAYLPFWIQIHGVPLHYWEDGALRAIGKELGEVEDCIPTQAKVRVLINGLNPLEMTRDISLPSGEIIPVKFDNDNLEKHCFKCFSLTHKKDDCPLYENARERGRSPQWLGISQSNSMARLDEKRRKYEDMRREKAPLIKKYREHSLLYSRRNDYDDRREEPQYKPRHQRNYSPVVSEYRRGGEDPSNDRSLSRAPNAQNGSRGSLQVVDRPNKYVEPYRNNRDKQEVKVEYRRVPSPEAGSKSIQSPALPISPHSSDLRRTLSRREEEEDSDPHISADRRLN
ncbi:hypothetical protein YC2023_116654 [Brassica napus]